MSIKTAELLTFDNYIEAPTLNHTTKSKTTTTDRGQISLRAVKACCLSADLFAFTLDDNDKQYDKACRNQGRQITVTFKSQGICGLTNTQTPVRPPCGDVGISTGVRLQVMNKVPESL